MEGLFLFIVGIVLSGLVAILPARFATRRLRKSGHPGGAVFLGILTFVVVFLALGRLLVFALSFMKFER